MARHSISVNISSAFANGSFAAEAHAGTPSSVDVGDAIVEGNATDAGVDAAQASAAAAKLATAAAALSAGTADTDMGLAQTAALAAQNGIVALTPLTNAIAIMKATPNQTNADAVDTIYNTAVTGVHDAILTLDGLINATKNACDVYAAT